jgi:6-phosphogluconolactonase (cycloisomerase 2 family)
MDAPGPNPDRQNKPHLHSVYTDLTGDFLFANDLGADITRVWSIESDTGRLTECPGIEAATGGDGPRHGVFREVDGVTYMYVINELSETVSGFVVTYPDSGCLSAEHFQTISTFPANATKPADTKAAEIHIKGDFLYASNRNDETFGDERDSIAQYAIGEDGELEFLGLANAQGFFPRTFSISEDGTLVAIGGQTDAVVSIVERDTETGLIGDLLARISVGQRGTYLGEDGLSAVTWAE